MQYPRIMMNADSLPRDTKFEIPLENVRGKTGYAIISGLSLVGADCSENRSLKQVRIVVWLADTDPAILRLLIYLGKACPPGEVFELCVILPDGNTEKRSIAFPTYDPGPSM